MPVSPLVAAFGDRVGNLILNAPRCQIDVIPNRREAAVRNLLLGSLSRGLRNLLHQRIGITLVLGHFRGQPRQVAVS